MTNIYCHIHTPVNIAEEKKLHDTLILIEYFQEYIQFTRENGYEKVSKWLNKKNLLNDGFLQAVSQYWIEDVHLKQVSSYKYFQKNNLNKPVIPDKYLKNIFKKVLFYSHLKEYQEKFNEEVERELNIIENELFFIKDEKNRNIRQLHYQNKIFEILLDNFLLNIDIEEQSQEINNINFYCETLLSQHDLFVYKTGSINGYKDFNFKLTKNYHSECLRENTFVKLCANSGIGTNGEAQLKYILEKLKAYSHIFTNDTVDFGIEHLKRIIGGEASLSRKKLEVIKDQKNESEYSNVALLQKTQTIISETEDHIISRYNSLKNHTNIYFAPDNELTTLLAVLNMDKGNLKRLNNLIWEKPNKIETELIKFTFKKGNLPYSASGFASLNF